MKRKMLEAQKVIVRVQCRKMRQQVYLSGSPSLNVASLKLQLRLIFWTEAANGNITDMIDDDASEFRSRREFSAARA